MTRIISGCRLLVAESQDGLGPNLHYKKSELDMMLTVACFHAFTTYCAGSERTRQSAMVTYRAYTVLGRARHHLDNLRLGQPRP